MEVITKVVKRLFSLVAFSFLQVYFEEEMLEEGFLGFHFGPLCLVMCK